MKNLERSKSAGTGKWWPDFIDLYCLKGLSGESESELFCRKKLFSPCVVTLLGSKISAPGLWATVPVFYRLKLVNARLNSDA